MRNQNKNRAGGDRVGNFAKRDGRSFRQGGSSNRRTQILLLMAAGAALPAAGALAGTYSWNITSSGAWDTTTANWAGTGTKWTDGNSAVFDNNSTTTQYVITVSGNRTASSVTFGNSTASDNKAYYSISGGTLNDSGNFVVQGNSNNSGAYGSNPTVTVNGNITVTGSTLVGRSNLTISGGNFTTNLITANPTSADWADVTISGGNVTATNGINGQYGTTGSNGTSATFQLNLNGGTLYTPSINVADREVGTNNNAELTFNGTAVTATGNNTTFVTVYAGNNTYVGNGSAIINTNGYNVGIGVNLLAATGSIGGLTKSGSGNLTLSGSTSYSGATTISAGVLMNGSSNTFNAKGTLALAGTGVLDLGGYNAAFTDVSSSSSSSEITNSGNSSATLTVSKFSTTINSLIADGASGTVALAFSNNNSSNILIATSDPNTFTGGITLLNYGNTTASGTRLRVSGTITTVLNGNGTIQSSPFGTGAITIGQAATDHAGILFDSQGNNTLYNGVVFNTDNGTDVPGFRIDGSAAGLTLAGTVTANLANAEFVSGSGGATSATLTGQVTGNMGLTLASYTGGSNTLSLTLNNQTANANNYKGNTTVNTSTTLALGASNQIPNGNLAGNVIVNGNFTLNGYSNTINGLSGNGTIDSVTGTSTLTVGGNNATGASDTFSGVIRDSGNSSLTLTKIGNGTLTISGNNTYAGSTSVNVGSLALNNTNGNVLGATAITVANGATLSINGNNSIASGGSIVLNGGNSSSQGTLSFANVNNTLTIGGNGTVLTLGGSAGNASLLSFNYNSSGNFDSIQFTSGNLSMQAGGATVSLSESGTGILGIGNYTLLSYANVSGSGNFSLAGGPTIQAGGGETYSLFNTSTAEYLQVATNVAPNTAYWTGSQSTGNWSTISGNNSTNFSSDAAGSANTLQTPGAITDVVETANSAGNLTQTLGGNFTINSLTFTGSGTSNTAGTTISGGGQSLTILAAGSGNNSGGIGNYPVGTGIVVQTGSGNNTIGANVVLGNSQTWTNQSTSPLTVSGNVSGSGIGLVINDTGGGGVVLTGANSFSGSTTVSAGTLQIGNGSSGSNNGTSGYTVAPGANLAFNQAGGTSVTPAITDNGTVIAMQSGNTAFNNVISGNGSFVQSGSGTTIFPNGVQETYTGGTIVSAGVLSLAGDHAGDGSGQIGGNLTINTGGTVNAGSAWALGYSGSSYVQNIAINGGTLAFGTNAGQGGTAASNITLQGGNITATGGTGVDLYNQSGAFDPTITVNSGSGPSTISANLNLRLGSNSNYVTFNVAGTTDSPELVVSGNIGNSGGADGYGSIVKTGAGEMDLNGTNSYSGSTSVQAGTLRTTNLTGALVVGTGSANSGTIAVGPNATTAGTLALSSTSATHTWNGGGTYQWKITTAGTSGVAAASGDSGVQGVSGNGTGQEGQSGYWDLITIASGSTLNLGSLSNTSSATQFVIAPTGNITGGGRTYSWVIAQAPLGGITLPSGYTSPVGNGAASQDLTGPGTNSGTGGAFVLNTSGLTDVSNNPLNASEFSLEAVNIGAHEVLVLDYSGTPEPGTTMLVLGGAVSMLMGRRRRRRQTNVVN